MGQGDFGEPDRDFLYVQGGLAAHDSGRRRQDSEYVLGGGCKRVQQEDVRPGWQIPVGFVLRGEGGSGRLHAVRGQHGRPAQHSGELRASGPDNHAADRRGRRASQPRGDVRLYPDTGRRGLPGGCGEPGSVPGVGGIQVHHGGDSERGRRNARESCETRPESPPRGSETSAKPKIPVHQVSDWMASRAESRSG